MGWFVFVHGGASDEAETRGATVVGWPQLIGGIGNQTREPCYGSGVRPPRMSLSPNIACTRKQSDTSPLPAPRRSKKRGAGQIGSYSPTKSRPARSGVFRR